MEKESTQLPSKNKNRKVHQSHALLIQRSRAIKGEDIWEEGEAEESSEGIQKSQTNKRNKRTCLEESNVDAVKQNKRARGNMTHDTHDQTVDNLTSVQAEDLVLVADGVNTTELKDHGEVF